MTQSEDDEIDPEAADQQIAAFIDEADRLAGPPVAALAEDVERQLAAAFKRITALLSGTPHNKVLATMLLLGQRARSFDADDARHWQLLAASTLMSALIIPSVGPG